MTASELPTCRDQRDQRDLPTGSLRGLLGDLIAMDPGRRPASAGVARAGPDGIGVPAAAPCRRDSNAPFVPDRQRRLTLLQRWRVQGTRAAQ